MSAFEGRLNVMERQITDLLTHKGSIASNMSTANVSASGSLVAQRQGKHTPKVPTYIELKGWITDWENPDESALSKKDGTALWNGISGLLHMKYQQHIEVEKTLNRITRILLRKIIIYMCRVLAKIQCGMSSMQLIWSYQNISISSLVGAMYGAWLRWMIYACLSVRNVESDMVSGTRSRARVRNTILKSEHMRVRLLYGGRRQKIHVRFAALHTRQVWDGVSYLHHGMIPMS